MPAGCTRIPPWPLGRYGTRGNSCNKNALCFISPLSPSAVSLRPCGVRLKLSGVLLWSHGVRLELDVVSVTATCTRFEAKQSLLRLHSARLGFAGVLLWPHALAGFSAAERAKAERRRQLFRHL